MTYIKAMPLNEQEEQEELLEEIWKQVSVKYLFYLRVRAGFKGDMELIRKAFSK